jgi:Uma2 family endonuclease
LSGKPCRVFAAPFDVCLAEYNENDDEIRNVVQPDITIVCDERKLRKTGYFGVPSLIIEISSTNTSCHLSGLLAHFCQIKCQQLACKAL